MNLIELDKILSQLNPKTDWLLIEYYEKKRVELIAKLKMNTQNLDPEITNIIDEKFFKLL